ncbi:MAG: hypothetical protein ABJN62_10710 [Halioglobus sp.]
MDPLYNIYYSGELLEGHELDQVRAKLAKLFKASDSTLDKLFSGSPQLVKRECDKATAIQYKKAMENAGAKPLIKALEAVQTPPPEPASEPAEPQTAAERIAALAAAPDQGAYDAAETTAAPSNNSSAANRAEIEGGDSIDLAPEGTEVLKPDERSEQVVADIDTSNLDLDDVSERLSEEAPEPPSAPNVDHLSMGEVGESIPALTAERSPIEPNTDGINLAPEGTDFSDCSAPDAEAPALDLSGIALAPEGSDVLDEEHRNRKKPPPPSTDHISLQD